MLSILKSRLALLTGLLFVLVAGCGRHSYLPESGVKTLATDISPGGSRAVHLYFREGAKVVRTRCPEAELGRTRDRCPLDRKEVDARWFLEQLSLGVGAQLPGLDATERELYIRISDIDSRLIEIVSASVDPASQASLQQKLRDIEARIAVVEINIRQFDIQIRAIEAQLVSAPTADLVAQAALVRRQRGLEAQSLATLQNELRTVRKQYVDVHGSGLSDHNYTNLLVRRDELVTQLQSTHADIDKELGRVVALRSVIEMLEDAVFTTEVINQSASYSEEKEFVAKFEALFGAPTVLPGDCRGVAVPGDYATLMAAWRALEHVGGTICVGPGDFSTVAGTDLNIMPSGVGLVWEIAGAGTTSTTVGIIDMNLGSCKQCKVTVRDLTMNRPSHFGVLKDGSEFHGDRLQFNQYVSFMLYPTGTILVDRMRSKYMAMFYCAAGPSTGLMRITNSVMTGSLLPTSQRVAASISDNSAGRCGATVEVVNNTFANGSTGLQIGNNISALIQNNLAVGNKTGFDFAAASISTVITTANNGLTGNIANYAGAARPGDGYVTGATIGVNVNIDPPTLLSDSPLRGAGKAAGAPLLDFFGKPRDNGVDIGAVQY